jgi:hypothetical protein
MKPDLQELLGYWQKALRLLDWRVTAEYVRDLRGATGDYLYGLCKPLVDNKTAWIGVYDPETPPGGREPQVTPEEALVHELCHLHFAPFGTCGPAEEAAEEQAVWAFAEALVANKGTGREATLSRAMVAHARQSLSAGVTARRTMKMDPLIIAALEAALEAEDPKAAIQALLEKIKAAGAAGDSGPPAEQAAAAAGPPGDEEKDKPPPMARAARERPPAPAAPRRPEAIQGSRAGIDSATVKAMVAEGLEGFRRDELLEQHGSALKEEDLRWARTQPYEVVRRMIAVATQGEPPRGERAARGRTPTRGAGQGGGGSDAATEIVSRAMRLAPNDEPAVVIDPTTHRLSISHSKPIAVQTAAAQPGVERR